MSNGFKHCREMTNVWRMGSTSESQQTHLSFIPSLFAPQFLPSFHPHTHTHTHKHTYTHTHTPHTHHNSPTSSTSLHTHPHTNTHNPTHTHTPPLLSHPHFPAVHT